MGGYRENPHRRVIDGEVVRCDAGGAPYITVVSTTPAASSVGFYFSP
jgi:hypothetical protein